MIECFPLPRGSFWRSAPYGQLRSTGMHRGIDYAANVGTPLYAPVTGRVTVPAFEPNGAGHNVWVTGADGQTWKFFHMSRIDVRTGQYVAAGQVVGAVGNTGRSSGPHLHIELHAVWPPTQAIDPTAQLNAVTRYPGESPSRPIPTPIGPPTGGRTPIEEDWMGKTIAVRGEAAQYRLVDDGFGQLRRQPIPDLPRRAVLARAELIDNDLIELTDPAEIASFRAIPEVNPQLADQAALKLAVMVIEEVKKAL